jgi:hypothetical protein
LYFAADGVTVFHEGHFNPFNKLSNEQLEFPNIYSHHLGELGVNEKIILE